MQQAEFEGDSPMKARAGAKQAAEKLLILD
jgi:hypothetical protein